MWTIYDRPTDHPTGFVVRRFTVTSEHGAMPGEAYTAASLEDARASLPPDLTRLARWPEDEPQIVETWL